MPCNCKKPKGLNRDPYVGRQAALKDGTKGVITSRVVDQRQTYILEKEEGGSITFHIRELEWLLSQ